MFGPLENPDIIRKNKTWLILDTSRGHDTRHRGEDVSHLGSRDRLRDQFKRDIRHYPVPAGNIGPALPPRTPKRTGAENNLRRFVTAVPLAVRFRRGGRDR